MPLKWILLTFFTMLLALTAISMVYGQNPFQVPEEQQLVFAWDGPFEREDGTPIPADDIVVTVYSVDGATICIGGQGGSCAGYQLWESCMTYYATAFQKTTGLTSDRSELVEACTDPKPIPPAPPSAPQLRIGF